MNGHENASEGVVDLRHEKEFLYTVLNLPNTASGYEIRERYRALSVTFHPDKQHDDASKELANTRFLEIQKAYEVLCDPFLRQVYDVLGNEGLTRSWSPEMRSLPPDVIREFLVEHKFKERQDTLEKMIRAKGQLTCVIDMQSLVEPYAGYHSDPWYQRVKNRVGDVAVSNLSLKHKIETKLTEKTRFIGRANVSNGRNVFGTIRHQFSPRWTFEGTTSLLRPNLNLRAAYQDQASNLSLQTSTPPIFSLFSSHFIPTLNINFSHRLFHDSLTQGSLGLSLGPNPSVNVDISKPTPFGVDHHPNSKYTQSFPSQHGFGRGAHFYTYGIGMGPMGPGLRGEWGVTLSELAMQFKVGVQWGVAGGLAWLGSGTWAGEEVQVVSSVSVGTGGVAVFLELCYLEQRLTLPINLSPEYDPKVALWATVIPSTAFALIYQFVVQPRRRKGRIERIRMARRAAKEEVSESGAEVEGTIALLRETARRHMEVEGAGGGLTILEAFYGSTERDENGKELMVDVTIPLQALVHHSQLHIPGHRSKSGMQGFHDPAPSISKILRVRYQFRGRSHFAEIPDYLPVVLPLADHLVK